MINKVKYKINKVLPLVYDDTLSYYEVLCKLISKVNECIDEVNSFEEQISDLDEWREIVNSRLDSIEEQLSNIPTYTAGKGIQINNGEIIALNNIGAKDISSEITSDTGTITDTTVKDWLKQGAPIIIDSSVQETKITLYLSTYGSQFIRYTADWNGYLYAFRYNINTDAYSWLNTETPGAKIYLHTMTVTNQNTNAQASVYAYSFEDTDLTTSSLDSTEAQHLVQWYDTVIKAGVTNYQSSGIVADFTGTEILSIWNNTDNNEIVFDMAMTGNISTMFSVPIGSTTILDTVTEV